MSTSSSDRPRALVVCAHPDDETLWFASVLARYEADVVSVTCGWDENTRRRRELELAEACSTQGVRQVATLGHPDDPRRRRGARLDVAVLMSELSSYADNSYDAVFTHGPYGEVNQHPHHQDVSYAVHQVFDDVLSVAWNQYPAIIHTLTEAEFELKQRVMGTIYWQEYAELATTYEIAAQERFARVTRTASEIFYWGIANFGDHHELLGSQHRDMWGFATSPYERQRHDTIAELAAQSGPWRILEVGAAEGHLTQKLAAIATVDCIETAPVYVGRLQAAGYRVVPPGVSDGYDLVVLAAVLEYMTEPDRYLAGMIAPSVITDTHPGFQLDRVRAALPSEYRLSERRFVAPSWERMRHDLSVESLRIYKIGAEVALWQR